MSAILVWSMVEASVAVIAACLPAVRSLIMKPLETSFARKQEKRYRQQESNEQPASHASRNRGCSGLSDRESLELEGVDAEARPRAIKSRDMV